MHLSLQYKGGSSTGFRLLRTIFLSQLCQLPTTRTLLRTETNITKGIKKRISRLFVVNNITQSISQQLPQLQSFETGSGGWAKDDLHSTVARCHRQSKMKLVGVTNSVPWTPRRTSSVCRFSARERARSSCSRESLISAAPAAATPVTASHCVPLRKPMLPQGGA